MNLNLIKPLHLTERITRNTEKRETKETTPREVSPESGTLYWTNDLLSPSNQWHEKKKKKGVGVGTEETKI